MNRAYEREDLRALVGEVVQAANDSACDDLEQYRERGYE